MASDWPRAASRSPSKASSRSTGASSARSPTLVDGDQSACRVKAEGTHTGPDFGIPPTGKRVAFTGIIWTRWHDGKIIESWNEFDAWGLMQQLTGPAAMKVK